MSSFGDALVIRILADSSDAQRGLGEILNQLDELQTRMAQVTGTASQWSRLGTAISSVQSPLQSLGRLFDQVQRQAERLGNTSVSLNVSPALNALSTLSAAIARVQGQLQALSMATAFPTGGGGGFPAPTTNTTAPRQFAAGGPVEGPAGIDRVPAWLTAGEFVLNREAVSQLGVPFLQQLNQQPALTRNTMSPNPTSGTSVTNHSTQFGVTVNVQQPSELGSILETLVLEEVHLRHRRG